MEQRFFNRDLSWLSFNGRVMEEASIADVPLLERLRFLSIFSSNLDEFYRVRMPVLHALKKIGENEDSELDTDEHSTILQQAVEIIDNQQTRFGAILTEQLIPAFKERQIHFLYNELFPEAVKKVTQEYFLSHVLAFLQPVTLTDNKSFFPENNKLYFVIDTEDTDEIILLNIPSGELPRFKTIRAEGITYVAFLDDIIRNNLDKIFSNIKIKGSHSIKITRDAELDLKDEYSGDLSGEIEKQLKKRDFGLATRFLHEANMPLRLLQRLVQQLALQTSNITQGGRYHNLKDFNTLPPLVPGLLYPEWPSKERPEIAQAPTLTELTAKKDLLISTPYQSYDAVLRFFNEAAINPDVIEIYTTLYRVASNSLIVNALISAAKNGKHVQVMVELKARFDEANNLKWAKKMREAGVKIFYSVNALKIHAKIVLVKTREGSRIAYNGLLATGNFNETTAKFYTDHILFTSNADLLREMELLFIYLARREKPSATKAINFKHLLVAGFNLKDKFIELIDREIALVKQGKPGAITIKINNLEERALIGKLYEASQAGVKVSLIVRSICCLVPGMAGLSENITVKRLVGRYLEHGRVFIFNNNGSPEIFLGSADWMNRNIYHRIEVCFPVLSEEIKKEIISIVKLQMADNVKAVYLDQQLQNVPVAVASPQIDAQKEIYKLLSAN